MTLISRPSRALGMPRRCRSSDIGSPRARRLALEGVHLSTFKSGKCVALSAAVVLAIGLSACNKTQDQTAQNQPPPVSNGDPANGNLASADQSGYPPQQSQPAPAPASGQSYAPPAGDSYSAQQYNQSAPYDQSASYEQPVEASEPPPPLPDYSQPPAPGDDYIWTPGYWGYASSGYYWVPGAWIVAPYVGALWTPPWWGYDSGAYHWHGGYWGPHIGYYGGIDYGYGYTGRGYYGAYWNNGRVEYNRAVTNVDVSVVHNVYNYNVPNQRANRVSYNGGRGGIEARPTPQEQAVLRDPRTAPVSAQVQHAREASSNRAQFVAPGGSGRPAALVASRPLPTTYHAPAARPPAAAVRTEQRPTPGNQATRVPENRPAPPVPQARPPVPENRTTAQRPAPVQTPQNRPAPEGRPEARPAPPRPAAQAPLRESRPIAPPRPVPQARPEPIPTAPPRPAPVARPQAPPQEARPAPPPSRPAPQARPEHVPTAPPRPAPVARPQAPREEARPAPTPPRPATQAHPEARPQEARPAPQRPAPKKEEEHK